MFEFPYSLATPLACGVVCVTLLTNILSPNLYGYGASNIFAYHGAFMVIGFVLLMPLAALSYSADCGARGNAAYPNRASRRVVHGTLNLLAAMFIILGYLVAFVYHQAKPRPAPNGAINAHLPFMLPDKYSPLARSAHVVIGWLALSGTAILMLGGLFKFVQAHKGSRVMTWHGKLGPIVWLLGLICICIAAYFEYTEYLWKVGTWSLGQVTVMWVMIAGLIGLVSSHFALGSRRHLHTGPLVDEDDGDDSYSRTLLQ